MGDGVLSLPFVRAAREHFDVTVVCSPLVAPLFRRVVGADHTIAWEPPWTGPTMSSRFFRWGRAGIRTLIRQLRGLNPAVSVCSWADPRTQLLMTLCGAPVRIGFPASMTNLLASHLSWRRRQVRAGRAFAAVAKTILWRPLLTHSLSRANYRQHHIEDWCQIAGELGLAWDTTPPWLPVGELDSAAPAPLCDSPREAGRPVCVVHAGGRLPCKRWPYERFASVIEAVLTPQEIPVVLIQAPGDEAPVVSGPHQKVVATPALDDLINVIEHADLVLCNDSLAAHLGAALGKRVVTVFGTGSPDWFVAYGNRDLAVESDVCPDRPCMDHCTQSSYICLEAIAVEDVTLRLQKALDECSPGEKPGERRS